MSRYRLTPSEQPVGRRLPKDSPYIDQLMASFVRADGTFCGRLKPSDRWLAPAHKKARQNGWIRFSGMSIGFGTGRGQSSGLFFLTEKGQAEATAAVERVKATREARAQWSREHGEALRARANQAAQ